MIFVPNTNVKLLTGIPLTNTYKDTLGFASATEQANWFAANAKRAYTDFRYQRYDPSLGEIAAIRVPEVADNLYDCNYLMFQNSNYGTKWFYAFITNIIYLNPNTTEIRYELDVFQTWKFDFKLKESFVVREHTNNDAIGANLVEENVEKGEYVYQDRSNIPDLQHTEFNICIATTFDEAGNQVAMQLQDGVYTGVKYNRFDTPGDATVFIRWAVDNAKSDGILSMFMFPKIFGGPFGSITPAVLRYVLPKQRDNIDGYVPRNNKLFCSPYNTLMVTDNNGTVGNFPYEYFASDDCQFGYTCAIGGNPEVIMYPYSFKCPLGVANSNERMSISGYPQIAYTTDVYKVYLAQNASSLPVQALSNALNVGANIASFNLGGTLKGLEKTAQHIAQLKDMQLLPPQAHGTSSSETTFSVGLKNFTFWNAHIRKEYAIIIDRFFDMYGYATNLVKVPNITGRKSWNYVKTVDCNVVGNVPANDLSRICQAFDDGITFWHSKDVGNYSQDNSII